MTGNGNLNSLADFAPHVNSRLRKRAGRAEKLQLSGTIKQWLTSRGRLIRDTDGNRPYLLDDDGSAIPLDVDGLALQTALARAGFNPSESAFQWLLADLRTGAFDAGTPVKLARWAQSGKGYLRVSCGGNRMVFATAGGSPLLLENGDCGCVFAADASIPAWQPTTAMHPVRVAALNPPLTAPPEVPEYTADVQRALLYAWLTGLIAGVRPLPILAALGGRGSGKSWLARGIAKLLMGGDGDVTPLSDDPRDFQTLTIRRPLVGLDNVDDATKAAAWLPDALATAATGGRWQGRQFHTRADVFDAPLQAAIIITSRTATFARADVAERTLPLFCESLSDDARVADSALLEELLDGRSALLTHLAQQSADMQGIIDRAPNGLPVRFLDFGRLVWAYYAIHGDGSGAVPALMAWRKAISASVGDANPLLAAIIELGPKILALDSRAFTGKTPTELINLLQQNGANLPHYGGGKRIAGELRELQPVLLQVGWVLSDRKSGNATVFDLVQKP